MILILSVLIILAICWAIYCTDEDWGFTCPVVIILGGSIALVLVSVLSDGFGQESGRTDHSIPLYSIKVDNEIRGSFFLGTGSVDGVRYYYGYVENGRGGFILHKFEASETSIFEKDAIPSVEWQTVHYKTPWWISPFNLTSYKETKRDLIVPKNTIIKEFKL